MKCRVENDALRECMRESDRDWTQCQDYVQKLKECFAQTKRIINVEVLPERSRGS